MFCSRLLNFFIRTVPIGFIAPMIIIPRQIDDREIGAMNCHTENPDKRNMVTSFLVLSVHSVISELKKYDEW